MCVSVPLILCSRVKRDSSEGPYLRPPTERNRTRRICTPAALHACRHHPNPTQTPSDLAHAKGSRAELEAWLALTRRSVASLVPSNSSHAAPSSTLARTTVCGRLAPSADALLSPRALVPPCPSRTLQPSRHAPSPSPDQLIRSAWSLARSWPRHARGHGGALFPIRPPPCPPHTPPFAERTMGTRAYRASNAPPCVPVECSAHAAPGAGFAGAWPLHAASSAGRRRRRPRGRRLTCSAPRSRGHPGRRLASSYRRSAGRRPRS